MSMSVLNRRWAKVLLEALTRHNVRHICIAPGSRSTPLTLEAASNHRLVCHTHFDERGLGHLALGLAKASQAPVAVIVTSGTAVANLYPAVIEAGLTGERLVVLTADRPPELIDCGANQAIRQQGIFASHPTASLNLPRPSADIPAAWLVSAVDDAMNCLMHGALHVNCPFAEPLYGGEPSAFAEWSAALGEWWQGELPWLRGSAASCCIRQNDWPLWRQKRGLLIAGQISAEEGSYLAEWAELLGWPLIGDTLSQTGQPLPCADLWLTHPRARQLLQQAQLVIQFGAHLTGKRLLQWQAQSQPEEYWLVAPTSGRLDPAQHQGRRIVAPVYDWLQLHDVQRQAPWAAALEPLAERVQASVMQQVEQQFGEAQLACRLPELLPHNGQLFLGNSLIIRLIDALAQLPAGYPVYGNRGASGIDGLIATAAGVQRGNTKPTLVVIGDLSALYDLNSLALLKQSAAPMVLIVVNNNGGSIFSMLPTPSAQRQRFYQMPHGLNFTHAAALFGMEYACPANWQQLSNTVEKTWLHGGTLLLELQIPATEGAETWQKLLQQAETL